MRRVRNHRIDKELRMGDYTVLVFVVGPSCCRCSSKVGFSYVHGESTTRLCPQPSKVCGSFTMPAKLHVKDIGPQIAMPRKRTSVLLVTCANMHCHMLSRSSDPLQEKSHTDNGSTELLTSLTFCAVRFSPFPLLGPGISQLLKFHHHLRNRAPRLAPLS